MRVSYDWLKTITDVPESPKELSDEYIRTGTEVEAIDVVGESFDHVVTAQVLEKTPHPDSDHMYVCKVSVGDKNVDAEGNPEPLQIVCGAQNFEAGDHIVTAMIGAELPGGIKIKNPLKITQWSVAAHRPIATGHHSVRVSRSALCWYSRHSPEHVRHAFCHHSACSRYQ